jgi:hypothetical protein
MKRMRDEVDNPETLVDRLRGIYPNATPPYATSPLQQEAAREIERLRKDVARYHWAREHLQEFVDCVTLTQDICNTFAEDLTPSEVDAKVDKAISNIKHE